MAVIPGSVEVTGFIAPSDSTDVYPSHDALYGMDGYRSVADNTERDAIPSLRRRWGMEVFTQDSEIVWRLDSDLTTWIDTSAGGGWALDGNTNGALKTIGTLDNFDLPVVTNNTEKFRVKASGKIGQGTSSPSHFYDAVSSQDDFTTINITNTSSGGSAVTRYLLNNGTANASFELYGSSYSTTSFRFQNGATLWNTGAGGLSILASEASSDIRFYAGGVTQKAILKSTGKFGIGVTPTAYLDVLGTTEQVRVRYDNSNYYTTTVSSTGGVTFDAVGSGSGFRFSDRVGINDATSSNSVLNITSLSGDIYGAQFTATNLTNNGIGFTVTSSSPTDTSNVGLEGVSSCAYSSNGNTTSYGVRGRSVSSGYNNAGVFGEGRNGVLASYGVFGYINSGATTVSSAGTRAVFGQNASSAGSNNVSLGAYNNSTSAGSNAYGVYSWCDIISGVTNAVAGYFKSNGGTNNYAIITEGGSSGFGTIAPDASALVDLVSTTQGFKIMKMTATQASAITKTDALIVYVTDTNGTFTSLGFWGVENNVWIKL